MHLQLFRMFRNKTQQMLIGHMSVCPECLICDNQCTQAEY
jgi:hypothetical protein